MAPSPQELYQQREKRISDVISLKKPDRVPILALFGSFTAQYAGITHKEELYDVEKHYEADYVTNMAYEPDMVSPSLFFGPALDALDYRQLKWAGHGLPDNVAYQYVEGEYMKEDEYDAFLYDPSDFVARTYWPRVFAKLAPFGQLPPLRSIVSYYMGGNMGFMPFGTPQGLEALEALRKAGEESMRTFNAFTSYVRRVTEAGFPLAFGAGTEAPFDALGDFFRGTRSLMIDMYRRPDKVIAACEKLLPTMIEQAVGASRMSGNPRCMIPLHKGQEGFMSLEQFRKFYWPTFRELLHGLVREGLNPIVLVEGCYNSRLEVIKDVPPGKIVYWFEEIDMAKAKETLTGTACIMGNVPMSLLVGGAPEQVREHCKGLIDIAGKDGGYIMSAAAADFEDAKFENIKAMFEATREYGVY